MKRFLLDWRVKSMSGAAPAQLFYLDDRQTFHKDIEWLADDPAPVILVSANHREVTALTKE